MKPEEIKAVREKLELTQEQFAREIGVTLGTIQRWEHGPKINSRGKVVQKNIPSPLALKRLESLARKA